MKRVIRITYDCRPDEPSAAHKAEIQRVFAELGWTMTQYGGGSSNVDSCYIEIQSEDRELDRTTLIAVLKRLGVPTEDDTGILGDVS
jgi:hypothetical protein